MQMSGEGGQQRWAVSTHAFKSYQCEKATFVTKHSRQWRGFNVCPVTAELMIVLAKVCCVPPGIERTFARYQAEPLPYSKRGRAGQRCRLFTTDTYILLNAAAADG